MLPRRPGESAERVQVGRTPSLVPLEVPVHREWSVDVETAGNLGLTNAIEHLASIGVTGLGVHCETLSDDGLLALRHLPCLTGLRLWSLASITDDGLAFLDSLRDLERVEFYLDMTGISGRGLAGIGALARLATLGIHGCPHVDDAALAASPR